MISLYFTKTIAFITLLASSLLLINVAQAEEQYELTIKGNDVTLSINNEQKKLKKGQSIKVDMDTLVCFESGKKGVVTIKGEDYSARMTEKTSKCKLLPKDIDKPMFQTLKGVFARLLKTTGEESKKAVARSGEKSKSVHPQLITFNSKEYFVIETQDWVGASEQRQIKLQILADDGQVKAEYISDELGFTSFILPKEDIMDKDGKTYSIRVVDMPLLEGRFILKQNIK